MHNFNAAASTQTIYHGMAGQLKNELEKMWKEAIMSYFKVLSQNLHGISEENREKPQSGWSVFRQ
jgi:hypothetical protein